ncbi:MAG: hypothetical protein EOO52_04925 [Gammaproteobacteria bacterium]|nr:MAG: hypothetical protein EOO52_04925 [Gammaproteobacteria bacterium]
MSIDMKKLWLLCLPLLIFISWQMREPSELVGTSIHTNVTSHDYKNNFFLLERALSGAYVVNQNRLRINAETEKYLSQVAGLMDGTVDAVLLEKTFPSLAGKELLRLSYCYKAYKHEEERIVKNYIALQTNQLLDYRPLQNKFFGETTKSLFAAHHSFYESSEAAGVELVVPLIERISVSPACLQVENVD